MPIVFAAADVSSRADSQTGWVSLILREFGRSQATGFVLDAVKWTLLGALLGIVVAIVACVLFSRAGWYELRWRFARALRWAIIALTVVLAAVLFGLAGFWSGAIAGSERVLSKGQLATEVFPRIADGVAYAMAWVQVQPQFSGLTNKTDVSLKLDEFRAGKWELHAAQFLQQLDSIKEETITNLVAQIEQSAFERAPKLKGGLSEKLVHQFLNGLGRLIAEKKAASELKGWGVDQIYFAILQKLKTEAMKSGNPDTIAHSEITALLVREGIVPGILKPIRSTARTQQLPLIAMAVISMVVPPLCIRLARSRSSGPLQPNSAPPPARPVAH